MPVI